MQVADCVLTLNKLGSTVPLRGITPGELTLLNIMHKNNAGRTPVEKSALTNVREEKTLHLPEAGDKQWTNAAEVARLRAKYPAAIWRDVFGGANPALPKTFDEVYETLPEEEAPVEEPKIFPPAPKVEPLLKPKVEDEPLKKAK